MPAKLRTQRMILIIFNNSFDFAHVGARLQKPTIYYVIIRNKLKIRGDHGNEHKKHQSFWSKRGNYIIIKSRYSWKSIPEDWLGGDVIASWNEKRILFMWPHFKIQLTCKWSPCTVVYDRSLDINIDSTGRIFLLTSFWLIPCPVSSLLVDY